MKLKRNVPLMYIIASLMWGRFFIPVLALFYIASQVTLTEFSIIMSLFSLSIILFEIPTGVLADLLGKKKTLLISRACYILEIFLIAFFDGFWIFLIAKLISGLGVSLSSGTNQALLFDTLKKQKRENQHKRISGSINTVSNISMAVIFTLGSFLFAINPKLPAIISLPFVILGFILTFFLEEPYLSKKRFNTENYFKHLRESLEYFKKNDVIKYLSFFTFFSAAIINIGLSFSSVYFEKIFIPLTLIGILAFTSSMTAAFASKKAHKIEKFLGEKNALNLIQYALIVSLFLISLLVPYFGYLFFLLIPFMSGFSSVVIGDYANNHISSSHRASLLSIMGMIENISIFLFFPLVGFFANSSLSRGFLFFGIINLIGFILLRIYSKKLILKFNK